jgi:MFS family permease
MVLGGTEALGFAAAMPSLQSLLTQGSGPSEVGRIQGMYGTTQTACTAVSAALAGAAFAYARWLPFLSASVFTAVALTVTAIVWRTVPGHVHPTFERIEVDAADGGDRAAGSTAQETGSPAGAQAAVGVSSEVQ